MANLRSINYWNSSLEEADNNILTINFNRAGRPTNGGRVLELHPPAKAAVKLYGNTYPTQAEIDEFYGSKNEFLESMFYGARVTGNNVVTALIDIGGQCESVQGSFLNNADADGIGGAANSKGTIMPTNRRCTVKEVSNTSSGGVPLPLGTQRVFLFYPFSGLFVGDEMDISDPVNFIQNTDQAAAIRRVNVTEVGAVAPAVSPVWISYDIEANLSTAGNVLLDNNVPANWYNNAGGYSFVNVTATTPLPIYGTGLGNPKAAPNSPLNRVGISQKGNIAITCYHQNFSELTSGPSTLSIYWRSK
tara:strand:+ start:4809 stop:5720 length:912 start_codon:yes stop_codon:yes gene_type:complete